MSMRDKIKGMRRGNGDKASGGIDKAGGFVDEKTKGKYSGQVDKVQEKLKGRTGEESPDRRQHERHDRQQHEQKDRKRNRPPT